MERPKQCATARFILFLSNIGFIIACIVLFIIALWIIGSVIYSLFQEARSTHFSVNQLLDEVALLVFAIAVIDVFKFLLIEEVMKSDGEKEPKEARRSLAKFVVIIATALSLEGLVLTIEVAKTDLTQVIYPVILFIVAAIFITGLGLYQKFNHSVEGQ